MHTIDLEHLIYQKKNEYSIIRRDFHRIPELGFEEKETTNLICQYLMGLGIQPHPLNPTGVVAYIGPEDKPVIALRADIDGLAVKEESGLSYSSVHEGLMHACGHDGHITALLGAASLLKEREEELSVRVKLIFQPSEENARGAKMVILQDVLDDVDAIFGLHLFSDYPCGLVNIEEGPRMAQTDKFSITFEGKGGHAGKPHLCIDSTVLAAEFVMSAQSIVAREVNPVEAAVVTIGSFHSGTQYNIISPKAVIEGTCRSFDVDVAKTLQNGIEKRAHAIADGYGAQVSIQYEFGSHPPVENHGVFSREILAKSKEMFPAYHYGKIAPMMLGEDFSCYQVMVPGVFALVGCGRKDGVSYPNHHPKFDIEEDALVIAVSLHLAAVAAFEEKNEAIIIKKND